jgi:hypothetical protein
MGIKIFSRPYKVRKAALRGKEVSIPSDVPFKHGDVVIAFYSDFVLYVPQGTTVNEELLMKAIKMD